MQVLAPSLLSSQGVVHSLGVVACYSDYSSSIVLIVLTIPITTPSLIFILTLILVYVLICIALISCPCCG